MWGCGAADPYFAHILPPAPAEPRHSEATPNAKSCGKGSSLQHPLGKGWRSTQRLWNRWNTSPQSGQAPHAPSSQPWQSSSTPIGSTTARSSPPTQLTQINGGPPSAAAKKIPPPPDNADETHCGGEPTADKGIFIHVPTLPAIKDYEEKRAPQKNGSGRLDRFRESLQSKSKKTTTTSRNLAPRKLSAKKFFFTEQ